MDCDSDVPVGTEREAFLDLPDIIVPPSPDSRSWRLWGQSTPKSQIIFFAQIIIIYVVISVSLINLSISNGDSNLWSALLCSSFGLLLPSPTIKTYKENVPSVTQ